MKKNLIGSLNTDGVKVKVTTTKIEKKDILEKLICDKCKKESDDKYFGGWSRLIFDAGFGSEFDGDWWELDFCEECFWNIYESCFGIKPTPGNDGEPGHILSGRYF